MDRWARGVRGAAAWFAVAALFVGCVRQEHAGRAPTASTQKQEAPGTDTASVSAPLLRLTGASAGDAGAQPIRLTRSMASRAMAAGRMEIVLADGTHYPVRMERGQTEPGGGWTVFGKVQTRLGAQSAVLTFGEDAVFGVLPQPDGRALQIATNRGRTIARPAGGILPPGSGRPGLSDAFPPPQSEKGHRFRPAVSAPLAGAGALPASAEAFAEVRIDVLGLYSQELVDLRGSVTAAETEVTNLIEIANQAHKDSGSIARFSLVGLHKITLRDEMVNQDALTMITNNLVAGVDIRELRHQTGADLVFLVRPYLQGDRNCGLGWLLGAGLDWGDVNPDYGFSVSNVEGACGPYVVAHELGHNLGSAHNREAYRTDLVQQYGAYPYSFGYRQDGESAFATIMAYQDSRPWLGYFSNPASTACGSPCGKVNRADNVRSLNLMAGAIAAFNGPSGTLSIGDATGVEPSAGQSASVRVPIRLSGPAPAGGVSFRMKVAGGSATAGSDYVAPSTELMSLPEGQSETMLYVQIKGDDLVEGDETLQLRLVDVVGSPTSDAEARVLVIDDDPRIVVTGRMRFPEGQPAPTSAFQLMVGGTEGGYGAHRIGVSPPDFAYSVPVVRNSVVTLIAYPPAPWVALPLRLGQLTDDTLQDYQLLRGVVVSGQLRLPKGAALPRAPIPVSVWESYDESLNGYNLLLEPPDYRYTQLVAPGSTVQIEATPEAPYLPYSVRHQRVQGDLVSDISLSSRPTAIAIGLSTDYIAEGRATTHGTIGLGVQLSAPAPAGGVSIAYRTRDGSATAGEDFVATSGIVTFAPGEMSQTFRVDTYGDDDFEGNEYFDVVFDQAQGAVVTTPQVRLVIADDDAKTGGPAPVRRK